MKTSTLLFRSSVMSFVRASGVYPVTAAAASVYVAPNVFPVTGFAGASSSPVTLSLRYSTVYS